MLVCVVNGGECGLFEWGVFWEDGRKTTREAYEDMQGKAGHRQILKNPNLVHTTIQHIASRPSPIKRFHRQCVS